ARRADWCLPAAGGLTQMRLATLFFVFGIPAMLCGQEAGGQYSIDVHRVNTEHAIKVTGTLYVGTAKYRVQTECFSSKTDYPCIVPQLGRTSVRYEEHDGNGFLQWLTKPDTFGQQAMGKIVDIEIAHE